MGAGSAIGAAVRKLTPWLLLQLGGGALVLAALSAAWLQIPDSHVWQFVFSMVSAVVLVCAFLWLAARTLAQLRGVALRWPRMFWLLLFVAAGLVLVHAVGVGRDHEDIYAGYWVSKMSSGRRFLLTYERLCRWQGWFYDLVEWVAFALLVPLAMEVVASGLGREALRVAARVYRRWLFWVVTIGCGLAVFRLTEALAGWTPGRGLAVEFVSMGLRLGVGYVVDVVLVGFCLALTGVYLGSGVEETNPTSGDEAA